MHFKALKCILVPLIPFLPSQSSNNVDPFLSLSPSQRSESIAAWMNGLEIAYLRADLLSRELMLNTDISTQFIVAPLMDAQKREGIAGHICHYLHHLQYDIFALCSQ